MNLEKLEIPRISLEDIQRTTQQAKQLVLKNQKKKERSFMSTFLQILRLQGWKTIALEGVMSIALLLFAWLHVKLSLQVQGIALLLISSVIFSIIFCFECVRSNLYGMYELEDSCAVSFERLLIWKMLILSTISLCGVIVTSFYLSISSTTSFLTLVSGGCIPFLLLNILTLKLFKGQHVIMKFIVLYVISLTLSFASTNIKTSILMISFLNRWGVACCLLLVAYLIGCIYHNLHQEESL